MIAGQVLGVFSAVVANGGWRGQKEVIYGGGSKAGLMVCCAGIFIWYRRLFSDLTTSYTWRNANLKVRVETDNAWNVYHASGRSWSVGRGHDCRLRDRRWLRLSRLLRLRTRTCSRLCLQPSLRPFFPRLPLPMLRFVLRIWLVATKQTPEASNLFQPHNTYHRSV